MLTSETEMKAYIRVQKVLEKLLEILNLKSFMTLVSSWLYTNPEKLMEIDNLISEQYEKKME